VALLSAEYPPAPGGVGDYTRRLASALVARGHQVSIFTILDSPLQGTRFWILDCSHPSYNPKSKIVNPKSDWGWRSWAAVIAALDAVRPDVLHIQYQTGAYDMHPAINFPPWRLRQLGRAGAGRPAVAVTAHDLLPPYLFPKAGPLRAWVTRRILADADAAIVTNQEDYVALSGAGRGALGRPAQRPAPSLIPLGSNIAVAPPEGYDRAAWRARLGVAADETLVAFFGLLSRTKGVDTLLDALEGLPASVRLLLVGGESPAPQDRDYGGAVRRRIAAGALGARVQITGHCAEEEVSAHLLAADIAALPFADGASFRRGSLLAALAHGLPVITTLKAKRQTLNAEAFSVQRSAFSVQPLQDGEHALLVPPGDAAALAGAIARLAEDAALRARLGEGGRALAAQFGWDAIAERHEEVYRSIVAP
jgi:glycosyltransferase involved in cell wall biosynthesis